MKFSNSIELEIRGERALFRDPLRPQTLPVPSCEALKGILGSIYWNPDFIWVPDSLRVMEPIGYTREGARTSDGSRFTNAGVHCLKDVRYQLRAHFVWNEQRPGSVKLTERDEIRHFRIALRSLARGGRRWVCLGRADCPAAVRSVHFGEGAGAYDSGKAVSLGILYPQLRLHGGRAALLQLHYGKRRYPLFGAGAVPPARTREQEVISCRSQNILPRSDTE